MSYNIKLAKAAGSDLEALYKSDRRLFNRIISKIESLSEHPKEGKPLIGNHTGEFSLRVGNYRIVYEIDIDRHIIFVLTIKHRKHVY